MQKKVVHQPHDTLRPARHCFSVSQQSFSLFCGVISRVWVSSLSHSLRDEGLLRKEPPAEHSAFEALTERVTQITTAFQQKNHNYEGCHAVRLLSWLTVVVAATQHSILGEVQATARIQAEVASRLGGAGRGARGAETDDGYRKKD